FRCGIGSNSRWNCFEFALELARILRIATGRRGGNERNAAGAVQRRQLIQTLVQGVGIKLKSIEAAVLAARCTVAVARDAVAILLDQRTATLDPAPVARIGGGAIFVGLWPGNGDQVR